MKNTSKIREDQINTALKSVQKWTEDLKKDRLNKEKKKKNKHHDQQIEKKWIDIQFKNLNINEERKNEIK